MRSKAHNNSNKRGATITRINASRKAHTKESMMVKETNRATPAQNCRRRVSTVSSHKQKMNVLN